MAQFIFKLPDIGEGIAEAEIVNWHVNVGEVISEDQALADVMTDKATVEMESPVGGTVIELAGEPGDQISIGATLVVIETEDSEVETPAAANEMDTMESSAPAADPVPIQATVVEPESATLISDAADVTPEPVFQSSVVLASPAVRSRAKELDIDLVQVKSTGSRIRHGDLDAHLLYGAGQGYRPAAPSVQRADETIKVIGMRKRIAENMAASKRHIPHFTYVEEIDVTAFEAMRVDLNANRGDRPKLTMLPLLIQAICMAIPAFPMINARYDDEAKLVTRSGSVHLGIATQTDMGLTVPVIRDAQERNIWQLASEIARLADAARTGKATLEKLSGSTLTITSLGPLGGIATTPVINRPEVAILGPNRVIERPVIRDGEIVIAKLMNLSISCDHRVVDGWDAANFIQEIRKLVETPVLLFAD